MPAAARSRLCSRVSAGAGAFARSAMSLALSASVITFAQPILCSLNLEKVFSWSKNVLPHL